MLKKAALALVMGRQAERLRGDRAHAEAARKLQTDIRSIRRLRGVQQIHWVRTITKQRCWIERLEADAHSHNVNLCVMKSERYNRQEKLDTLRLHNYISQFERHKDSIREVQKEIRMLRNDIQAVEAALTRAKRKISNRKTACSKCRVPKADTVSRQLELTFHHFNMQLTENRRLMSEIHHLNLEKAVVNKIHTELEKEMKKLSKQLADHIAVARELYENRKTTKKNMVKLQEHHQRRTSSFDSGMASFDSQIEMLKNTQKFVQQRNKPRPLCKKAEERAAILKQQLTPTMKDLLAYRDTRGDVTRGLGRDNMCEVTETFIQLVDENYMLCRNLTETRNAGQELLAKIQSTKGELTALRASYGQQAREATLRRQELKEKMERYAAAADEKQRSIDQADATIDFYIFAVLKTLYRMGYTEDMVKRLTGALNYVTPGNVMRFLAEVEGFVNKLWDMETYVEYRAYNKPHSTSLTLSEPVKTRPPRRPTQPRVSAVAPLYEEGERDSQLPDAIHCRPLELQEMIHMVDEDLDSRPDVSFSRAAGSRRKTASSVIISASAGRKSAEPERKSNVHTIDVCSP